jgi:hypothetical protein
VLHQETVALQVASVAEHHSITLGDRFDAHPFRVGKGERARDAA